MSTDSGSPARTPGNRWLRNVASGYVSIAAEGLLFLVLTPLFVDALGIEGYALWILATTVSFFLKFLDLGLEGAQIRFHARYLARSRPDLVQRLTRTVVSALLVAGIVGLAAGILLAALPALPGLEVPEAQRETFRLVLILLAINLLVAFPASALDNVYEGVQRFDLRNLRGLAVLLAKSTAQLGILLGDHGLVWLAAVEVFASVLQVAIDLLVLPTVAPRLLTIRTGFDGIIWRRIRSFALWSFVDDLLAAGLERLGSLLVVAFLSLAMLTPYSLCVAVTTLLLSAIQPVLETLFPLASGLHARRRRLELIRLLSSSTQGLAALAAPVALALAVHGRTLIEAWVPDVRGEIPTALIPLFVADTMVSILLSASAVVLIAMNGLRSFVLMSVAEVALFAVAAALLAPQLQLVGLGLAALVANVALGFGVQLPLVAARLRIPTRRVLGGALLRQLASLTPAAALGLVLEAQWPAPSLLVAASQATVTTLAGYAGLLSMGISRRVGLESLVLWRRARR